MMSVNRKYTQYIGLVVKSGVMNVERSLIWKRVS